MRVMEAGRPRVIRKVTKRMKRKGDRAGRATGAPKEARDQRLDLRMSRVNAAALHICAAGDLCTRGHLILRHTTYAALVDPTSGPGKFIRGRRLPPDPQRYHHECVPHKAKPLVRLLWPTRP